MKLFIRIKPLVQIHLGQFRDRISSRMLELLIRRMKYSLISNDQLFYEETIKEQVATNRSTADKLQEEVEREIGERGTGERGFGMDNGGGTKSVDKSGNKQDKSSSHKSGSGSKKSGNRKTKNTNDPWHIRFAAGEEKPVTVDESITVHELVATMRAFDDDHAKDGQQLGLPSCSGSNGFGSSGLLPLQLPQKKSSTQFPHNLLTRNSLPVIHTPRFDAQGLHSLHQKLAIFQFQEAQKKTILNLFEQDVWLAEVI
jgi:hypothetical protein